MFQLPLSGLQQRGIQALWKPDHKSIISSCCKDAVQYADHEVGHGISLENSIMLGLQMKIPEVLRISVMLVLYRKISFEFIDPEMLKSIGARLDWKIFLTQELFLSIPKVYANRYGQWGLFSCHESGQIIIHFWKALGE